MPSGSTAPSSPRPAAPGPTSTAGATSTASSPRLAEAECLVCEKKILVDLNEWEQKTEPIAICRGCGQLPKSTIAGFYRLRTRLSGAKTAFDEFNRSLEELRQEIDGLKEDLGGRMDGIVEAQKELEQELFQGE